MGTVFTFDIRDPGVWDAAIAEAVAWLHRVDAVFSTYKDNSDIARLRRDELSVAGADPDVAVVFALCAEVERETDGYFTMFAGTELDPTGLVKGWAIERASDILLAHGSRNHAVNGGGDIQLVGEAAPDHPWTIGISDPLDNTRILAKIAGRSFAVATSGVAERGLHIINPHNAAPAHGLASITVVGRSLSRVDAYATAAFAMGPGALAWVESRSGYEALVVFPNGNWMGTSGFPFAEGQDVSSQVLENGQRGAGREASRWHAPAGRRA
jgi:FAD:protein FMN transferase